VVVLVKDDDAARDAARRLAEDLAGAGVRVELDDKVATGFGRRTTDWELKGVPLRIEVGPRDVAEGRATVVRRDTGEKAAVDLGEVVARVPALLADAQAEALAAATAARDGRISDAASLDEAVDAAGIGWARVPWDLVRGEGEARLATDAVSVRCLQRADGSVPDADDEPDLVAYVARAY